MNQKPLGALYKYLQKYHATKMVNEGVIRIGTLYEYRDVEKHGDRIGDIEEGIKSARVSEPIIASKQENLPLIAQRRIRLINGGKFISMGNITFTESSPNCYIYCTSTTLSKNLAREFRADAFVKITDIEFFYKCITQELVKLGHFNEPTIGRCLYRNRHVDHKAEDYVHPALIKPPNYRNQSEVRAIWMPQDAKTDLNSVEIRSSEITRLCKLYEI